MDIEKNENSQICAQCGGRCCKNYGCHTHPDDILRRFGHGAKTLTAEMIKEALLTGDFSADAWDGYIREDKEIEFDEQDYRSKCWFIRSRHYGCDAVDTVSYGGICVNLTKHGCKFSWEDRPSGGRALIPNSDKPGGCSKTTFDKDDAVLAWLPYSDLIEEVVNSDEFDLKWTNSTELSAFMIHLSVEGKKPEDLIPE